MCGRATLTTVESRKAIPEPATAAARSQWAVGVPKRMLGSTVARLADTSDIPASVRVPRLERGQHGCGSVPRVRLGLVHVNMGPMSRPDVLVAAVRGAEAA